jgi:hypothetical protein
VVPPHLVNEAEPEHAVEVSDDGFPRTDDHYLHNHLHVRTGLFGFPGVTMQIAFDCVHKDTNRERSFIFEGSIRDSLHMAFLIRQTGLQVPPEHW